MAFSENSSQLKTATVSTAACYAAPAASSSVLLPSAAHSSYEPCWVVPTFSGGCETQHNQITLIQCPALQDNALCNAVQCKCNMPIVRPLSKPSQLCCTTAAPISNGSTLLHLAVYCSGECEPDLDLIECPAHRTPQLQIHTFFGCRSQRWSAPMLEARWFQVACAMLLLSMHRGWWEAAFSLPGSTAQMTWCALPYCC